VLCLGTPGSHSQGCQEGCNPPSFPLLLTDPKFIHRSCPALALAPTAPTEISGHGQWQGGVTDPEFPVPGL